MTGKELFCHDPGSGFILDSVGPWVTFAQSSHEVFSKVHNHKSMHARVKGYASVDSENSEPYNGFTCTQMRHNNIVTSRYKMFILTKAWFRLCCFIYLVSVRTFCVMYDHTFLNLQITGSDIRQHIKWVVSLVIAYGHFNLPQGFVRVCIG